MQMLEWEDNMSVGLYLIDEQHKELVTLINHLAEAIEKNAEKNEISNLIRRFYDYTTRHFKTEESLMNHETYPEYYEQVRQHLDCSMKALEFHRNFVHEAEFDTMEFFNYIVKWFREHTIGIDQTLRDHLRERELKQG